MADDELSIEFTRIVAERRIKEAIDDGVFDNLPGKGKPLTIDDDTLTPQHLRSSHRILRNAGVAPEWIQLEQEIASAKAEAQNIFCRAKERYEEGKTIGFASLRDDYRRAMKEANDMILKYSISTPFVHRGPIPFRTKERLEEWDNSFVIVKEC